MKKTIVFVFSLIALKGISQERLGAHFAVGSVIGGTTGLIFKSPKKAINTSLLLSTTAGVGKEIYDKSKGGTFSVSDVGATVLGSLMTTSVVLIFKHIKQRKNNSRKYFNKF